MTADTITLQALEHAYRFITQPQRMDTPKGGPKTATYRVENFNALTAELRAAIARARSETAFAPVPMPVDVTDETTFPTIAEACRHARQLREQGEAR